PFWRKGDWMRPLERTNIWTAILTVAVILLLFSPALDPARLSVMDQVARLERGAVAPDKFDYRFLRFESGKAGQAALQRLARSTNAAIAAGARTAQENDNRYDPGPAEAERPLAIEIWPAGAAPLPAGFVTSANRNHDLEHCQYANLCLATRRDLNGDGSAEILIVGHSDVSVFIPEGDGWALLGHFDQTCRHETRSDPRDALRAGRLRAAQPAWPDLVFADGHQVARLRSNIGSRCGGAPVVTVPPPVVVLGRTAP
ncbi:MAG: hypothetical protein RL093_215, partial [Pseudomonadota bacterium]